ncbi:AsmA-like C-terminal region-containing protein [Amorphus sp. 3PC139-8]|uniref:YhdP family protein n=1 Tax=Amorphus sp. 3PC139-8 TaxID=2735676 RepID=UPI00345C6AC8
MRPTLPVARRRRRGLRLLGLVAVALVGLFLALSVRVWVAPLTIPSADRTARSILRELAGDDGRVSVGGVSLAWTPQHAIEIVVRDVTLRGPAGALDTPEVVFDVATGSLLSGTVQVHSISISDPVLEVNYPSLGKMNLPQRDRSAEDPPIPLDMLPVAEQRLARISTLARRYGLSALHILNGELRLPNLDPRLADRTFTAIDATFRPEADGDVAIDALGQADSGSWRIAINRASAGDGSQLTASAHGIGLTDFVDLPIIRSGFLVSPKISAKFAPSGALDEAKMEVTVDEGVFQIAKDPSRSVDHLQVTATWSAKNNLITLAPVELLAGATSMTGNGVLTPPDRTDGPWKYQLQTDAARIGPDDIDGPPLELLELSVAGTIEPGRSYLSFDRLTARSNLGSIYGVGSLDFGPHGPTLAAALRLSEMSVATLMRMWPVILGYEARNWLVGNVPSGRVKQADMQFALLPRDMDGDPTTQSPMEHTIDISIAYSDGSLKLPGELPAITAATGTANVVDRHVTLDTKTAELIPEKGGPVKVEGFYADVPSVTAKPPVGEIRTRLVGPAASFASLADADPIDALKLAGVQPDDLSGEIAADFLAVGPFGTTIEPDALDWSVDAALTNVSSSAPIKGQTIKNANLTVTANRTQATLKGSATVDGVKATVDMTQVFSGDDQGREGDVSFILTDAERKRRGWDAGSLLKGPVEIAVAETADGARTFQADLTKAQVTLPGFGWTKSAGVPAKATFAVVQDENRIDVNDLRITSDGLDIAGTVKLADGKLERASFDRFALRAKDSAKLVIVPDGSGYDVKLTGTSFDGRGVIDSLKNGGGDGGGDGMSVPIDIQIALDEVQGNGGVQMSGFTGDVKLRDGRLSALDLQGSTNGGRTTDFSADVAPGRANARTVTVQSGDVGRLLQFLDVYQRLAGGQGSLQATLRRNAPTTGLLTVEKFQITGDPAVEDLIDRTVGGDRGRPQRPLAYQEAPNGPATRGAFDQLIVPFSEQDGRIEISDAILRGTAIGGTAGGVVDLDSRMLQISGTAIPAYVVNNLFGRVPILGEILGGGKEGGLFGITFRLDGPMSSPNFSFNPISAVTPGIFRRIFEHQNADGVPAFQAPPPRTNR